MQDLPGVPPVGGLPGVQPWLRHPDSPPERHPNPRPVKRPRTERGAPHPDQPFGDTPAAHRPPRPPGTHIDERARAPGAP